MNSSHVMNIIISPSTSLVKHKSRQVWIIAGFQSMFGYDGGVDERVTDVIHALFSRL